ncbi:MAG: YqaJ viral recombinase family protein [Methylotenera sp.]|nr:YqaJ viral recombinase family protein [Oligoflexia bacterium]
MKYRRLELLQGSAEWKEARLQYLTASQVAVVLGHSPYQTLTALYEEKVTGHDAPLTEYQTRLFAKGHESETLARAAVEKFLKTQLEASTLVSLEHPDLLASLDGHCERTKVILEAKFLGKLNFESCRRGEIQLHHLIQIQAQLRVTGAEYCLYHATSTLDEVVCLKILPCQEIQTQIGLAARTFMADVRARRVPGSALRYTSGVDLLLQNRIFKPIKFTY